MNTKVTIIMYHYVREIQNSRYPDIKGLEIKQFKEQLIFLKKYYTFITMEQLIDSIENSRSLPTKAVLLTFDDAYIDHFTQVLPVLLENKVQGSFFPPAKAIKENAILDVNKIHFILASCLDKHLIINDIFNLLNKYRENFTLESNEHYFQKLAKPNRFDSAEVIFIKRLLQVELADDLRKIIINELFSNFVGMTEAAFSGELYMSIDQIKTMLRMGMHIGSHGYDHFWLNSLNKEKQINEIEKSIEFLSEIGADTSYRSICYPYGAYNDLTVQILNEYNFKLGLTTNIAIADIKNENRFTFSRLDTNDMPKSQYSKTNDWYLKG